MPKCQVCTAPNRDAIEGDLKAGLPFRVVATRNGFDKRFMIVFRHSKHMDAKPEEGGDIPEFKWDASIDEARKALQRAGNRHDVRAMAAAADLLQNLLRLKHVHVGGAEGHGDGDGQESIAALSDLALTTRRRELCRIIREGQSEAELRAEIADIELILEKQRHQLEEDEGAETA